MSDDRLADLFARIDTVLAGYEGQDSYERGIYVGDAGQCVRCSADAGGGDLCGRCRAFLLGDTDVDPAKTARAPVLPIMDDVRRLIPNPLAEFEGNPSGLFEAIAAGTRVVLGEDGRPLAPADALVEARRHLVAL